MISGICKRLERNPFGGSGDHRWCESKKILPIVSEYPELELAPGAHVSVESMHDRSKKVRVRKSRFR